MNTIETIATILLALGTVGAIALGVYLRIKGSAASKTEVIKIIAIKESVFIDAEEIMSFYRAAQQIKKQTPKKDTGSKQSKIILESHGVWDNYCYQ